MRRRRCSRLALWNSRDGSVNVFLIGITAVLFFCVAVLIDFARIAAFERLAETAAYSGVRSALSAYDAALYERYGLFARGGTDGGEIFKRVVSAAMTPENPDRGLRLLRADVSDAGVTPGDPIGLHTVLERQILEEMKYKAPIDFTLEVIERFKGLSSGLREAAHAADTMKRLEELFDSRQRRLEEALRRQKEAAEAVATSGFSGSIPYPSGAGSGDTAASAASRYGSYVGWVRSEAERSAREAEWRRQAEEARKQWEASCGSASGMIVVCGPPPVVPQPDLGPSYAAEIAAYERSARNAASGLVSAARSATDAHARAMELARQAVEAAEADNERMADILREARQSGSGIASPAGHGGTDGAAREIRSILDDASRLVLDKGWFDDYRRGLDAQDVKASELRSRAAQFESAVAQALANADSRNASALSAAYDGLFQAYQSYASQYIGASGAGSGGVIAARDRAIAELAAADDQRKEFERQSGTKRGEAAKLLLDIARLPYGEETGKAYERLRKRYEESLALNGASAAGEEPVEGVPDDDAEEYASRASGKAAGLFGLLDGMGANLRDEIYLNEYAVARFAYFRPQNLSGLIRQEPQEAAAGAQGGDGGLSLDISNQEAEYILYGIHNPTGNIAAAYAEIFAVRAAIRLMEGLVECRKFGHPLVVFAAAVLYSLEHALKDMAELIRTGKTELSKWLRVDITYKDYLRLFLLIHGSTEEKLSRVAALIELNTGYRLAGMPAVLTGWADVSVNLWFLPGVMRMFAAGGILEGRVVGGRYETTVVAGTSY